MGSAMAASSTPPASDRGDHAAAQWAVIASNGKVAMTYETKKEAEAAALWLSQTWVGERLRVEEVEADAE